MSRTSLTTLTFLISRSWPLLQALDQADDPSRSPSGRARHRSQRELHCLLVRPFSAFPLLSKPRSYFRLVSNTLSAQKTPPSSSTPALPLTLTFTPSAATPDPSTRSASKAPKSRPPRATARSSSGISSQGSASGRWRVMSVAWRAWTSRGSLSSVGVTIGRESHHLSHPRLAVNRGACG